jgi:WD40 repeat protein
VAGVTFSAHGYLLATADSNGNTYVWTVATDRLTATLHDPGRGGGGVAGVAFSPDGRLLATAYINGHVYVWRTGSAGF